MCSPHRGTTLNERTDSRVFRNTPSTIYGTGESYFVDVFSKLVKPGGQFGIVVPGLVREFLEADTGNEVALIAMTARKVFS